MNTNRNKQMGRQKEKIMKAAGTKVENKQISSKQEGKCKKNIVGIVFASLQLFVSVCFFVVLLLIDMLPVKYLAVIGVILIMLFGFTLLSQFSKAGKKVGWVFAFILVLILSILSVYIWKAHNVIDEVTSTDETITKLSDVSIIVLANSPYDGLEDLDGKEFGVQKIIDRENTESTLEKLESEFQNPLEIVEYESWKSQVQALYNEDIDAIVINELYRSLIEEDFEDFDTKTKILDGFTYVEEVKQNNSKTDIKVDTEPFNVYLSGNDAYGKINMEAGRSDVNIIATVNPKTKQILLTTTPRDFYVELPISNGGYYDKLTHVGMLGFDTSIETLEKLYQIEIDYYVRVNFSGFRDIVDALDGVEVYSEYEFTSVKGIHFSQGKNYLNGKEALAFVRERKAFPDGDFQRGKNQMAMIEAMANKIFSAAILTNYMDLMNSVSSCFITDMPRKKINDLVKMQLNDGATWTIVSNSVMGYGNSRTTYVGGSEPLSCVDPDVGDVALATELILKCMNGEKVVIPDKEAEGIYQGSDLGNIGQNYVSTSQSSGAVQSEIISGITGESSGMSSVVESVPVNSNVEQSYGTVSNSGGVEGTEESTEILDSSSVTEEESTADIPDLPEDTVENSTPVVPEVEDTDEPVE